MTKFQIDVIERLTRVETKLNTHLDEYDKKINRRENWKVMIIGLLLGVPLTYLSFKEIFI